MNPDESPPEKEVGAPAGERHTQTTRTAPRITPTAADVFDVGWHVGWGYGHRRGVEEGYAEAEREWQALMGVLVGVLYQPRQSELETARCPSDEPCPPRCRSCSRCVRYAAAWRNQRRYGHSDYPGVEAVTA